MTRKRSKSKGDGPPLDDPRGKVASTYGRLLSDISELLEQGRRATVRSANAVLTATYWQIGRRIVEFEQKGERRAEYGAGVIERLSADLKHRFGRGFSPVNLSQMKKFYLLWPPSQIFQTPSEKSIALPMKEEGILQTASEESSIAGILPYFPLPWSAYVRLLAVKNDDARRFYEAETLRGGWSVRQLDRQVSTQFFERAMKSKRPAALLARGQIPKPEDAVSVEEEIRDPYLLEFLNLKDEYGESDLEEALIRHMEWFLLEMGAGFTFVARQKRIRVGDTWYRIDLLLYHRGLRCLVIVDLKTGTFTHADAGQMNLYLNFAREHLMMPGEADPVGIILCTDKDDAVVKYATGGIRARVFASKYLTSLPDEETLRREILKTQRAIQARRNYEL